MTFSSNTFHCRVPFSFFREFPLSPHRSSKKHSIRTRGTPTRKHSHRSADESSSDSEKDVGSGASGGGGRGDVLGPKPIRTHENTQRRCVGSHVGYFGVCDAELFYNDLGRSCVHPVVVQSDGHIIFLKFIVTCRLVETNSHVLAHRTGNPEMGTNQYTETNRF